MIVFMASPYLLMTLNNSGDQTQQIAVIDETGKYASALPNDNMYNFVAVSGDADDYPTRVVIPRDVETTGQVTIYSESTIPPMLAMTVENALTDTIEQARLAASGIPNLQQIIDDAHVDVNVRNVIETQDGNEQESSAEAAMMLGFILAMVIYFYVFFNGQMIMNNVVEEKTNRIVEVVVSSCRPFHLMLGKIIGVGLAGLTQIVIWIVLLGAVGLFAGNVLGISNANMTPDMMGPAVGASGSQDMVTEIVSQALSIDYTLIIINFVLYFIGGYLLYSAIFAALGSAVDQANDAGQLQWPVAILMLLSIYAAIGCMTNPNGPMAFWCSIIPFTSPIVMMVRLPYDVPFWQLLLSHVLLYATALAIVWGAARIYRRGIMHYGHKASFKDLFKWLK